MTTDTYPLSTPLARLFLALARTLDDSGLLAALQPRWDVRPGISTFSLSAQRRTRSLLAALDPADLHRRILDQDVPEHALPEVLTQFRLPLTGTPEASREPGWTVVYEAFSADEGLLVWTVYVPSPDREQALERFRQLYFPGQPDSDVFRKAVIVLPGLFRHPGAAPGQGPEADPKLADTPALMSPVLEGGRISSTFTRWTHLDLPPEDLLRLFMGDLPVPPDVASLPSITSALQEQFHMRPDEVARLLGVAPSETSSDMPPGLDVLDRLYALGGLLDTFSVGSRETVSDWFSQPLPVLAWRRPVDLCGTRYGLARVGDVIQGLLDGMFA